MNDKIFLFKQWITLFLLLQFLFLASFAQANQSHRHIQLEPGAVYNFETILPEETTVFISLPEVADYQVLDNRLFIYAKKEGQTEIVLFDKSGKMLQKREIIVDTVLAKTAKLINRAYPQNDIKISKVGQTYLVNGIVNSAIMKKSVIDIIRNAANLAENDSKIIDNLNFLNSNQVNVKLFVVEVNKEVKEKLGFKATGAGEFGTYFSVIHDILSFSSIMNILKNFEADHSQSIAHILAEPNLSVLSGEEAVVFVGGEEPYIANESEETKSTTVKKQIGFKPYGIELKIKPHIYAENRIRLYINQMVKTVQQKKLASHPYDVFSTNERRANTTIELADGESFILGGLTRETEELSHSKKPVIGSIPIIGSLFRNASKNKTKTELMLIAQVNLVKPQQKENIVLPQNEVPTIVASFFNMEMLQKIKNKNEIQHFLNRAGFIY